MEKSSNNKNRLRSSIIPIIIENKPAFISEYYNNYTNDYAIAHREKDGYTREEAEKEFKNHIYKIMKEKYDFIQGIAPKITKKKSATTESKNKTSGKNNLRYKIKGYDIMPKLQIDNVSDEKIADFLVRYFQFIETDRKYQYKLTNINVDEEHKLADILLSGLFFKNISSEDTYDIRPKESILNNAPAKAGGFSCNLKLRSG